MAITPQNICLNVITDLGTLINNDPTKIILNEPNILKALDSPVNAKGIEEKRVQRLGKKFTVHVKYNSASCGVVDEEIVSSCTQGADEDVADEFFAVTGDKYFSKAFTFSKEDFRTLCNNWNDVMARKTIDLANDVLKAEGAYYTTEMYALLATYADGVSSAPATEKTLKLFNDTSGLVPNAMGLFPVTKQYELKGYNATPFIMVGGSTLSAWSYATNVFMGNTDGLDASRATGVIPFIDYNVAQHGAVALSDTQERALTWIPTHNQAIRYFQFEGDFVTNRDSLMERTIIVNGQKFDYSIYMPDCGSVTIRLGRGNALFNSDAVTKANCGGQPNTLNWAVNCGTLVCADVSQPISVGS